VGVRAPALLAFTVVAHADHVGPEVVAEQLVIAGVGETIVSLRAPVLVALSIVSDLEVIKG
jgi:hypothetical protein